MPVPQQDVDALVDAVVARLVGGRPPTGGDPGQLPQLPPHRVDEPVLPRARLAIAGLELTQSVQRESAGRRERDRDDGVPLVALKTLVVRVLPVALPGVGAGGVSGGPSGGRVTGELTVSIGDRVLHRTGPTRSAGARVGREDQLSRELWDEELTAFAGDGRFGALEAYEVNAPLNFVVPARRCPPGRVHLAVSLWTVGGGPTAGYRASASTYVHFLDVPAPRVALVRVNWTDTSGTTSSPIDAQMLDTLSLAERMLPFPYLDTTILGIELDRTGAFAMPVPAGGCNGSWDALLATLGVAQLFSVLFGLGDLVIGMVPSQVVPATGGPVNSGCARGTAGVIVGFDVDLAHELGHLYGRRHVFVSGDPDNDPDYPRQTGNRRSIGEVGIDTGTTPPTLYGPRRTVDVMAYANNGEQRWVSPYTYEAILEARGRHQSAPADPRRVRPVLVLDLRLHRSTEVEVRLLSRIDAPGPTPTPGDRAVSPLSLDLLDRGGRVLRTHHCWWTPPAACGCGCGRGEVPVEREPWLDLHEAVEWDEDCASIVLHRGDEPLLTVEVGEPPSVHIEGPEHVDDRLVARVVARHERERPSVVVLVTGDDGRTWAPVAVDPPDGEVSLDPALLPGGACRLRAVATAELCTAEAETETFELPRRGRRLHLRLPDGECPVAEGPVVLSAVLDTGGHGRPRDEEVVWRSDREGELGRGLRIVAELGPGEHEITVTAPDGVGDDAEQRGIIVVGGRDR